MDAWIYVLIALSVIVAFVAVIVYAWRVDAKKKTKTDDKKDKLYEETKGSDVLYVPQIKTKGLRGVKGELLVQAVLDGAIQGEKYVINNITARDENGNTFDIDHVLINKFGIWVIETKNYAGTVIGNEDDKEWIYRINGQEERRKNPIKQNKTHIYRLKEYLKEDWKVFHNLVVFAGEARIFVSSDSICFPETLVEKVNKKTDVLLTSARMKNCYEKIQKLKTDFAVSEREHVQAMYIKKHTKCPLCGAELVTKYSANGTFKVCTNERRCAYSLKIGSGWEEK